MRYSNIGKFPSQWMEKEARKDLTVIKCGDYMQNKVLVYASYLTRIFFVNALMRVLYMLQLFTEKVSNPFINLSQQI